MDTNRTPDAFLVPPNWAAPAGTTDRINRIAAELRISLGADGRRVHARKVTENGSTLVTLAPEDTYRIPYGLPGQKEHRYEWFLATKEGDRYIPTVPVTMVRRPTGEIDFSDVAGTTAERDFVWVGFLRDKARGATGDRQEAAEAIQRRIDEYKSSPQFAKDREALEKLNAEQKAQS